MNVDTGPSLIRHAVANLLENVALYSREDGSIRLTGSAADGKALLVVEDEGPGIDPEELRTYINQLRVSCMTTWRGLALSARTPASATGYPPRSVIDLAVPITETRSPTRPCDQPG